MKRLTGFLFFGLVISGCSLLNPYIEQSADKVAEGVNRYCEEIDAESRRKFRERVNAKLAPSTILVECK